MARLRALLMAFWVAFAFIGASGPKPCMGNGVGQACTASACACTLACTCQGAHAEDRLGEAPWGLSHCGTVDRAVWRALPVGDASCHAASAPAHFGYSQHPPAVSVAMGPSAWPAAPLPPPWPSNWGLPKALRPALLVPPPEA